MSINISKSTITKSSLSKSGANLTWDGSTPLTWNTITGTWDVPGQVTVNISKSTVSISAFTKSASV